MRHPTARAGPSERHCLRSSDPCQLGFESIWESTLLSKVQGKQKQEKWSSKQLGARVKNGPQSQGTLMTGFVWIEIRGVAQPG
jgi:hypothetical protein